MYKREADTYTGLYEIETDVSYYRGERMLLMGPMAQLLHHRAICFCLEHPTPHGGAHSLEDFIAKSQIKLIAFDIPDAEAEVQKLCSKTDTFLPVWIEYEDGYGIPQILTR